MVSYLSTPGNRHLWLFAAFKGLGSMIWGAADIVNVRMAERTVMQQLGDKDVTLGIILACVSIGCIISPFINNAIVYADVGPWLRLVVISYAM